MIKRDGSLSAKGMLSLQAQLFLCTVGGCFDPELKLIKIDG